MATWSGILNLDLRGEYAFQAELTGSIKLELNGKVILDKSGLGTVTEPSELVRLNKGHNPIIVTFCSPSTGDARLRLLWIPKGAIAAPLPSNGLFHQVDDVESKANTLRFGRELFVEYRCAKCHVRPSSEGEMAELGMDAPAFDGIGSRLSFEWIVKWILDPKSQRASAVMPQVVLGPTAKLDAEAAAAFLTSLKNSSEAKESDGDKEAGRKLYYSLLCDACHSLSDSADLDVKRISLQHVAQKFEAGALASFLKNPEEHYAWSRMPNFKLSADEATQLEAHLLSSGGETRGNSRAPDSKALIDRGKKILQTNGCLNCHALRLGNLFKTKPLIELNPTRWTKGCLAEKHDPEAKVPDFRFTPEERAALQAFGATDRMALSRNVPTEFTERQIRLLNCRECHGKIEGLPPLDILGGKLKPEWTKGFLAGQFPFKPRPWIEARMPAFASRAALLSEGLAAQHGFPPQTPGELPIDREAASVGQKLVSADGGFACVACHAVGNVRATQVFESAGINLIHSRARLLRPYYERWMRNPLAVDPATKMPTYFDEEGKSPLTDHYDGDGSKQIDAIWQYLRLGEEMPPPPGTDPSR